MSKRNIDFLYEIGTLRNLPRAWQQLMANRVQNIAEHTLRTTLIAWLIAVEEKADVTKVLKTCLLHDLSESRAVDIAFMHRDYVTRNGELAEKDLLKETSFEEEALDLLREYEERKTLEAKIVKDADNLDVDIELRELAKIGDSAALAMIKDHRPLIREHKLYTETAKRMWDEIDKADPNDWHQSLTNKWVNSENGAK